MTGVYSIGIDRRFADELASGVLAAYRREPRQQGWLAVRGAQEGLAQRAHRAAGRQQDQDIGELQRIAAEFGQYAGRQLVGEAAVDADGEDSLHRSSASASGSACSVPT